MIFKLVIWSKGMNLLWNNKIFFIAFLLRFFCAITKDCQITQNLAFG